MSLMRATVNPGGWLRCQINCQILAGNWRGSAGRLTADWGLLHAITTSLARGVAGDIWLNDHIIGNPSWSSRTIKDSTNITSLVQRRQLSLIFLDMFRIGLKFSKFNLNYIVYNIHDNKYCDNYCNWLSTMCYVCEL